MSNLLRRLHIETFVLNLRDAAAGGAARSPAIALTLLDDHTLEVGVSKEQSLNESVRAARGAGIDVLSRCATRSTGWRKSSCGWSSTRGDRNGWRCAARERDRTRREPRRRQSARRAGSASTRS